MRDYKILLSDATSYKAAVTAKFLRKTYGNLKLYTCDSRGLSKFLHTRYSNRHFVLQNDVTTNKEKYISEIINLIKGEGIDFYIPINSKEMNAVISCKEKFGNALSYWGDYECFQKLNDKLKLQELCESCNIRMPKFYRSFDNMVFPIVIKPRSSSASRGIKYFKTAGEFNPNDFDMSNYVVQEYIKGIGVGYSVFADKGKIQAGYGHKRLAEYPVTGGSSMYRQSFEDDRMAEVVKALLEKTNWSGFAMFEFKLTKDGQLYLIEVNPRIWGSINQGLQNGVNYFANLFGIAEITKKGDVKTYLSPFVYLSFLLYLLRGNFKPLFTFLANISKNKADISLFDDPLGWLASFVRII